jgi:CRISPR/Cas system-associated endonuclease Cas1
LFEQDIGEVVLKSGNMVSTGALASCGFWDIDVLITTQKGRPVAMLKSLNDDSHVKTRLCQYEAYSNGKWVRIAKQIVMGSYRYMIDDFLIQYFKKLRSKDFVVKTEDLNKKKKGKRIPDFFSFFLLHYHPSKSTPNTIFNFILNAFSLPISLPLSLIPPMTRWASIS